jgi:hypothetical protein
MRSLNPPASTHPRPLLVSLVATRLVKDLFGVGIRTSVYALKQNLLDDYIKQQLRSPSLHMGFA